MIFQKKQEKTPLELYSVASAAGPAENIKRDLGPVLGKELDVLISELVSSKPDFGTYSHIAGQIKMIDKIMKAVDMSLAEAREALDQLRKEGL